MSDLSGIAAYIAGDNPEAAKRVLSRIRERAKDLAFRPYRGRVGEAPDTRELIIDRTPYIVIYRIEPDAVSILAVFHGARLRPETS